MYDGGKIVVGLAVFVGLSAFPVWYNLARGQASYKVQLEPPPGGQTECVAEVKNGTMRAEHMKILDDWRNAVVRDGNRTKILIGGVAYDMSLSKTCVNCHSNKAEFCDRCHNAALIKPVCWDCHVEPTESP